MIILAVDTTANTASCALIRDGRTLAVSTVDGTLTHSETMLPMVERMLASTDLEVADVDLFACAEGPGSFTGVRIGVAMIKGLAFSTGKPCVGVSALDALARNLEGYSGLVVPVMDARRNQVYTAIFKDGEKLLADSLIPLSQLASELEKHGGDVHFVGDGCDVAMKFFSENPRVKPTPAQFIAHDALTVALVAGEIYESADDKSLFTDRALSPKYLRAPQAEREREERLKKGE